MEKGTPARRPLPPFPLAAVVVFVVAFGGREAGATVIPFELSRASFSRSSFLRFSL